MVYHINSKQWNYAMHMNMPPIIYCYFMYYQIMGSDSASMIANAMALAWKEYGQPKYVHIGLMYVRICLWYPSFDIRLKFLLVFKE